jgi:choice-of-anchor C domain-containing protein
MRLSILTFTALLWTAGLAFASTFDNGSFEISTCDPLAGSFNTQGAGSTCLTAWTVTQNNVDYINGYWQASDGTHSIDLNGNTFAGGIEQVFDTVVGYFYLVTFDLAGNPDGGIKTLDVTAGGTTTSYSFDTAGKDTTNMGWAPQFFAFTANSTSTTLRFLSTTGDCCAGPALDNVAVTAAPEPSSLVLIVVGASALALIRRRNSHLHVK